MLTHGWDHTSQQHNILSHFLQVRLHNQVLSMGGQCERDFTINVTHLIATSVVGSEKVCPFHYRGSSDSKCLSVVQGRWLSRDVFFILLSSQVAVKRRGGPVIVKPDWIWKCWEKHCLVPCEDFPVLPFAGCVIAVTGLTLYVTWMYWFFSCIFLFRVKTR